MTPDFPFSHGLYGTRGCSDGRSVTELKRSLELAQAATRDGATAEETASMQQANDILLRRLRGVGMPAPTPIGRKNQAVRKLVVPSMRRQSTFRVSPTLTARSSKMATPSTPSSAATGTASGRPSVEERYLRLVEEALAALDRRGDRYSDSDLRRHVRRLLHHAESADPRLTKAQRTKIAAWERKAFPARKGGDGDKTQPRRP